MPNLGIYTGTNPQNHFRTLNLKKNFSYQMCAAYWLVFHLLLFLFLFCSSRTQVDTVDVHAAKDLINSGHRFLDVRTEEEFKMGHVEKALNIPYMFNTPEGRVKNPKFMEQVLSACSKEDRLVVGCKSGIRSVYATMDLLDADFKHVQNMGGGYEDWVQNGLPVKKPKEDL